MQLNHIKTAGTALVSVLLAGCTVYSPIWKQHAAAPVGPPMASGSATALVNRCEIVDIRLGSGYKCLDYGFKSTDGEVVRLAELRDELRAFGPNIGHLAESERQRFTKGRVNYVVYLLALKPSVYVGVPVKQSSDWLYCGDITCVGASWRPKEGPHGEAWLHWRKRAPVREGSFFFVPGLTPSSQALPIEGAPLPLSGGSSGVRLVPRDGAWTVSR